jgi:hypothetical protein
MSDVCDTSNLDAAQRCVDCSTVIPATGRRGPKKLRCDDCRRAKVKRIRQELSGVAIPLGGMTVCTSCSAPIIRTGGNKQFCEPCRMEAGKRRDLEAYYRRQGKEFRPGAGSEIKCADCETIIFKTRADKAVCAPCLRNRLNRYNRETREAERRASGVPLRSGITITCDHCGVAMIKRAASHRFCDACENQPSIRYTRAKRRHDPVFALNHMIAASIRKSLLSGAKSGRHWEDIVGYTIDDLTRHLERQFDRTMTWENRGTHWHIDHVIPISKFSYDGPDHPEFKAAWALSNLRPLVALENLRKNATRTHLL